MRERYLAEIRRSQREHEPGVLIGVRSICDYTLIGHHTLKRLIEEHGFPAIRLPDGRWCTSKRLIDDWIVARWKAQRETQQHEADLAGSDGGRAESQ